LKDELDAEHPDGTVLTQSPAAGKAIGTGVVALAIARAAVEVGLPDLEMISGYSDSGSVTMAGKEYSHSISYGICNGPVTWEYNLGKNFGRLKGVAG